VCVADGVTSISFPRIEVTICLPAFPVPYVLILHLAIEKAVTILPITTYYISLLGVLLEGLCPIPLLVLRHAVDNVDEPSHHTYVGFLLCLAFGEFPLAELVHERITLLLVAPLSPNVLNLIIFALLHYLGILHCRRGSRLPYSEL